ncbi:cytochrome [Mycolicibacterium moriokaense]|uniref:Steroid C26-monooxygenase n=1 Tax=Mycolicibacterium moriokaense TaxID=39691 RepID=A0AAD1M859_9MYCO|nr:cytochrome P450 [Mycolicibacterium moriokaense]MCV7039248.1 cytochrome P450 [Mycolicibacterium moriokaense]ORB26901.1 cytochrome [Mycolicibacterium moriokaense]BBX03768.1 cytochrome P450 [Mycolicibacterium moriokaense]
MTYSLQVDPYYDPFDFDIDDDPYPVWKRLRDEAPLYHNERYGFYALSRHSDVSRELVNWKDYRSGRGTTADIILNGVDVPPGIILFEDPPIHDLHRRLLSGVFTPRRMAAIEPLARDFCRRALEPLADADTFDFIADLGAWMPMRTIGYLLGIPEDRQVAIRQNTDRMLELSESGLADVAEDALKDSGSMLEEFIDWRYDHPSDDLMTDLVNAEVEEPDGSRRRLTRGEVLLYTGTVVGAGNETTTRLIGFAGQLLSDHPDQRRELANDFSLIPNAIEEVLRYEAPSPVQARYVARDVEHYGQTVPADSVVLLINGSANRDERQFPDADRFDIHRQAAHLSFGHGIHFCLGAALARVQARVALEEVLTRWPDWEVDYGNAKRAHTTSVRGWATLPVKV